MFTGLNSIGGLLEIGMTANTLILNMMGYLHQAYSQLHLHQIL